MGLPLRQHRGRNGRSSQPDCGTHPTKDEDRAEGLQGPPQTPPPHTATHRACPSQDEDEVGPRTGWSVGRRASLHPNLGCHPSHSPHYQICFNFADSSPVQRRAVVPAVQRQRLASPDGEVPLNLTRKLCGQAQLQILQNLLHPLHRSGDEGCPHMAMWVSPRTGDGFPSHHCPPHTAPRRVTRQIHRHHFCLRKISILCCDAKK